jgi:hypothetical protein
MEGCSIYVAAVKIISRKDANILPAGIANSYFTKVASTYL